MLDEIQRLPRWELFVKKHYDLQDADPVRGVGLRLLADFQEQPGESPRQGERIGTCCRSASGNTVNINSASSRSLLPGAGLGAQDCVRALLSGDSAGAVLDVVRGD